jgi:hypothetical protein
VLHTFALTFLIASFAILAIGIETKGMVLEQITTERPVEPDTSALSPVPDASVLNAREQRI